MLAKHSYLTLLHSQALSAVICPGLLLSLVGCSSTSSDERAPTTGSGTTHSGDVSGGGGNTSLGGGGEGSGWGGAPEVNIPQAYPEGPYGSGNPEVGEVIEDLNLIGFKRVGNAQLVSAGAYESFNLDDLRRDGSKLALIHTATMWCPSCSAAADDLGAAGDDLAARGILAIEVVLDGQQGSVEPTEEELRTWITLSDLTITTVSPADDGLRRVFPSREYAYVVDLETMKVLWAQGAAFSSPTIAQLGIDAAIEAL